MKDGSLSLSAIYKLCLATLLVGISSGCGAILLMTVLHFVQQHAYAYTRDFITGTPSFLHAVSAVNPARRLLMLSFCGLIAGVGWWSIFRYGRPLVSIADAVKSGSPHMPLPTTVVHALLQVITIGLGSPLGREVAPREIAAAVAIWIANKLTLTTSQTKLLLACGAGAGLGAVYNVPFSGALFTVEVILGTCNWQTVSFASIISTIAIVITRLALGSHTFYPIESLSINHSLMIWALVVGPLFGLCGYQFRVITSLASQQAPRDSRVILFCCINFILIGLLAMYLPALLGNGRGAVQLGLYNMLTVKTAAILLFWRVVVVWSSLRAGAWGGLLMPSMANGALIGVILGTFWNRFFNPSSQAAYALVGATAFLAAAKSMPVTAMTLIFEFTGMNLNLLLPISLAVIGAGAVNWYCEEHSLM